MRPPASLAELHDLATDPTPDAIAAVAGLQGPVVVAGAGGKMGFHLARMLRRALDAAGSRAELIAVSRFPDAEACRDFDAAGLRALPCDLLDDQALEALPDAETVFHLAGLKFETGSDHEVLRRFNVDLPRRVAARWPRARFVVLSTGCVYPFVAPSSGGSKESDPIAPQGAYAESCAGRERVFFDAADRDGTQSVIIRLNYSVDLRYGVTVDIARSVLAREPVDLRTGFFNAIWQGDAVAMIISSLALASSPPDILNVTGPEILSVRRTAEQVGDMLGTRPIFRGAEEPTAWLSDPSRAVSRFGHPRVSAETLVAWTSAWLARGGELLDKPTRFDVRDGAF